ncbi:MAG TPA: glycosyltransferase family 9 protein [Usitatibacter sp.]|nr:glycosyltransferase family 9 protein [Usitatibacter sp.]
MQSRFLTRSRILASAFLGAAARRQPRDPPRRVLIAHHPKMIGDTLLLAHLAAKARHRWPDTELVITASRATQPLFSGRPWGLEARAYEPDDVSTLRAFRDAAGYDLAFVPGDNRYGWFARAMGARWIVGFSGDRPAYKDRLLDDVREYPNTPDTWGDMAADLVPGEAPPPYHPSQWPAPPFRPFDMPAHPYAVIHMGASTALKRWAPERWAELAAHIESRGVDVAWSAGRGEEALVKAADPAGRRRSYAGTLDLPQMWHLIANAQLMVTPDTGLAHLSRLTFTPTVALFGPGSPQLVGSGRFFRNAPWTPVIVDPFPCRDQTILFKREVAWVRRCSRTSRECASPACMLAITPRQVIEAIARTNPRLA